MNHTSDYYGDDETKWPFWIAVGLIAAVWVPAWIGFFWWALHQ